MVIVPNKGVDLPFEIAGQVIIVEQNSVLQGLVLALDLSLGLGGYGAPRTCSMPLSSSHLARLPAT